MSCLVGQGFGVCGRYPVLKAWKQLLAWEPAWRQPGRQDVWGLAPVLSPTCCVSHSSPCFSFPICNLSCPDDFMALPAFLCCDSEPEREQGQQTGVCVCVCAENILPRCHGVPAPPPLWALNKTAPFTDLHPFCWPRLPAARPLPFLGLFTLPC